MRFAGVCYRAHDPQWSFDPASGDGAAIRGARFNPKGVPALYFGLSIMTAIKEANQGFAHRIDPCTLCSYEIDCEDIVDLTSKEGRSAADISIDELACAWMLDLAHGRRPRSWAVHDRLAARNMAGILVPSFAPGAEVGDDNLVLWKWGTGLPFRVAVIDPNGRLPKDRLSWR